MSDDQLSRAGVNDITDAVQQLLQKTLTDLKGTATAKGEGEPRLFFPHGIELISVVVKVLPADVEVTIAGEKGVKLRPVRAIPALEDCHMDVWADVNTEDIFRSHPLIWSNDGNQDVLIDFNTVDGCPLNECKFTVKKGQPHRTIVLNTVDAGEYHFTRTPSHGVANPKIIIQ